MCKKPPRDKKREKRAMSDRERGKTLRGLGAYNLLRRVALPTPGDASRIGDIRSLMERSAPSPRETSPRVKGVHPRKKGSASNSLYVQSIADQVIRTKLLEIPIYPGFAKILFRPVLGDAADGRAQPCFAMRAEIKVPETLNTLVI